MWERARRRVAGVVAGRSDDLDRMPEAAWPWPVRLTGRTPTGVDVVLRPLTVADGPAFQSVRRANSAWLEAWDATSPDPDAPCRTFEQLVEHYDRDARAGRALPFAVEVEGRFVGQLSVGSIVLGSFRSCYVGYWVSRRSPGEVSRRPWRSRATTRWRCSGCTASRSTSGRRTPRAWRSCASWASA